MAREEEHLIYRDLYIENDDTIIDYNDLLNLYSTYLSLFISNVPGYSEYYMDLNYLNHVINGFEYYQDSIFETSYLTDEDISSYILYKFGVFQQQGPIDFEQMPIQDLIFKVSGACQQEIDYNGFSSFAEPLVKKMYSNAYKIEMTLDKYHNKDYKGM